jgi:FtsP/CotA-like multicopper oxidase with cupredoxin domain
VRLGWLLVLGSLLALAALGCAGCRDSSTATPDTPEQRLLSEFAGSYPNEASPTGVVRDFEIVAAPTTLPLVDGKQLDVWAYNGQVPGPTLRIKLGETLRVRFTNKLPQATTIHWHGVRVPNGMDGVPNLTQPPVEPGGTFVYEFTPKDAGTFWFHPHVRASEQVERGLYGVLIVEDPAPAPYSREVVWVLDDWLLDGAGQIVSQFNTPHDLAHDGRWGNAITINGSTNTALRVQPGERIRLRMLNSANGRVFRPDFGDLDAKIIAVDGLYLREPISAGSFEMTPGNRLDIDIAFDRSPASPPELWDRFYAQRPNKLASFDIAGDLVTTPQFASPAKAHVPPWLDGLGTAVTHSFRLDAQQGGPFGIKWTIDGVAMEHGDGAHHHAPEPSLSLTHGQFAHLQFVNASARLHPIHFHGMFFRLLARNGVPVEEPFFRDTVLVHARETVDIGLVPSDIGTWMMHCHILEHAEAGMMTTIRVR